MPSKLTVFLDTTPLQTAHAHRGIGTYTRSLLRALQARRDITVYSSADHPNSSDLAIDLVHYPYFDLFFPTLPLHFKKKAVVTIHDVIPLIFPEQYKPGKRGKVAFLKQQLALKLVAGIVTVSEKSKQDIVQYLTVPAEKVFVAYNAGNPELLPPTAAAQKKVRAHYKLPKEYLLYVGDINYNKNIPQLIKMLKFLPEDISLVCVSKQFKPQEIPEWQWIETQIAMSDVAERVVFLTDVPVSNTEELAALYAGAVAYVQPSLYEGFGLPVIEAMQCLTPVVSANTGALPEITGKHALLADPTAEALAAEVTKVLFWKPAQRNSWTTAAAKWASRYTWKKSAAATVAAYTAILE